MQVQVQQRRSIDRANVQIKNILANIIYVLRKYIK